MANDPEATVAGPSVLLVRALDLTETEADEGTIDRR